MKNLIEFRSRTQQINWHIPNPNTHTHKSKHIKSTEFCLLKKKRYTLLDSIGKWEKKHHTFLPCVFVFVFRILLFPPKKKPRRIWFENARLVRIESQFALTKFNHSLPHKLWATFSNYTWFYSNSTNCYYLPSFQFHCSTVVFSPLSFGRVLVRVFCVSAWNATSSLLDYFLSVIVFVVVAVFIAWLFFATSMMYSETREYYSTKAVSINTSARICWYWSTHTHIL